MKPNQTPLTKEQLLTFSGTTDMSFFPDGDYFQFKNEKECQKFVVWLKQLELEHEKELSTQKAEMRELVYSCLYDKQWVEVATPANFEAGKLNITKFNDLLDTLNEGKE